MQWLQIIVLAIVQGITEFLPISSDGHLVAVEALFGAAGYPLSEALDVEIVLHLGTLATILVFYWPRLWRLLSVDRRVIGLLIVGTIPAVIVGLPAKKYCSEMLVDPLLAGLMLPLTGMLLIWAEHRRPGDMAYQNLSYRQTLWIGLLQATALLPGISRSGTTISMGLALGMKRRDAGNFSFLLAVPAVGGACALELIELAVKAYKHPSVPLLSTPFPILAVGVVISFLVGLLALRWLMSLLQHGRLHYFAYWCIPVGIALTAWQLTLRLTGTQ